MSQLYFLFIYISVLFTLVVATPIAEPAAANENQLNRRVSCPTDAVSARPFFKQRPRRDKSLFYANVGSQRVVEEAAAKADLDIVVKMLHDGYDAWAKKCPDFWVHISTAMAEASVGQVFVMLEKAVPFSTTNGFTSDGMTDFALKQGGPKAGTMTVWEKYEWPTLRANPAVTRIWRNEITDPGTRDLHKGIWDGVKKRYYVTTLNP
jgi:hypothetical protein